MRKWNIALGLYQNPKTAEQVTKRLNEAGLRRLVIIQNSNEKLKISSFHPSRILWTLTSFLVFFLFFVSNTTFFSLIIAIGLFAWVFDLYQNKIDRAIIRRFKSLVFSNEIGVILQVKSKDVSKALKILRSVHSGHPISFLLRTETYHKKTIERAFLKEPLTSENMNERAARLAAELKASTPNTPLRQPLLKNLQKIKNSLNDIRHDVEESEKLEQAISSSADWLLDNNYVIQGNIEEIQRNLPRKFANKLPRVLSGVMAGYPRVYVIARTIIESTANKLNREALIAFLDHFQEVTPLTIGELWALPLMLRYTLIEEIQSLACEIDRHLRESEEAGFWGNRLLNIAKRDPNQLFIILKALAQGTPFPSANFAEELIDHLYDEETILPEVRKWLEVKFNIPISETIQDEQKQKAALHANISNAIISLITLSQLSWRQIFESTSLVDRALSNDPIYPNMDFGSRDLYRHSIETLARKSDLTEQAIASQALEFAKTGTDPVTSHVGYYLIDQGRPSFEKQIGYRAPLKQRLKKTINRHATLFYLGSISLMTAIIELTLLWILKSHSIGPIETIFSLLFALLPVSELSVQMINAFMSIILPPFLLPKLSFEEGLPTDLNTLVVIPTMLSSPETITENIKQLEIHYLANNEPIIRFGLFVDFMDAPSAKAPNDELLLNIAQKGIQALADKYGADKFFLFHRERVWSKSENVFIGWERKRGKLESLNRYLTQDSQEDLLLIVGAKEHLNKIKYVITLDADTQLPKDSAKKLIGTIAHPLNSPRLSPEGVIKRGYTIIQPRIDSKFLTKNQSWFSRIFSDQTSTDPYNQAVSNIYQDLTHEGTYHGKGIYDVNAFHAILSGRFPSEHLLSHDLIEGVHSKVGFVSDLSLLDSFPENYWSWAKRQHRWMRGDWQIIDWLSTKVPCAGHQKVPNQLTLIDRWKILDNLRRAIFPVGSLALLLYGWFFTSLPVFWTLFSLIILFLPAFSIMISTLFSLKTARIRANRIVINVLRSIINISVLPHQALLSIDALCRVTYRRLVSHRRLLEWMTASNKLPQAMHRKFLITLIGISSFSMSVFALVIVFKPEVALFTLPFCLLWFAAPFIIFLLDKTFIKDASKAIDLSDSLLLRQIARKTWRFFDDFVGPATNWLPPDNYQSELQVELALRTSPTNIGLWLLGAVAANDLNFITTDDLIDRLSSTMATIKKMDRYEGHLFNWYDISTLNSLYPRYVSTVDSGNFLASLWTLRETLDKILTAPLFPQTLIEGLAETFEFINEENRSFTFLNSIRQVLDKPPKSIIKLIYFILHSLDLLEKAVREEIKEDKSEFHYWVLQLEKQLKSWELIISRYLLWADILDNLPAIEIHDPHSEAYLLKQEILTSPISLQMIASGQLSAKVDKLIKMLTLTAPLEVEIHLLKEALQKAQWLGGEKVGQMLSLSKDIDHLSNEMNMKFLFNEDRKLFSIGYHVDDRRLDTSYYDLLASEARIASLVSIAKGDVPLEHWWALGRSFNIISGRHVLLSWGGTMFEYLMPLLFSHYYPETMLGQACKAAVATQIKYAKKLGIPWGISEAAYNEIDARKTYQYRSFGVPGLGFKRGLEEDLVVSPYSTILALQVNPSEAIQNIKRLKRKPQNMLSLYGYYESIDFTRQQGPYGERGVIVYAFMAHHQGMALIAIDNLLNNQIMPNRFHSDPRIAGVESLLYEKPPLSPPIGKGTRKDVPVSRLTSFSAIPIMGVIDTPHSALPKVNILSNGTYSTMMTNAGAGYSRWNDIDITRWRSDTTSDFWGTYCYIKDVDSKAVWSASYLPTYVKSQKYSVIFKSDKVEVHRRDNEIETYYEIVVSPEDNAEVRTITLANLSNRKRILELTSYCELALAPHLNDRAHPAFNKLFIQTEAMQEFSGLLAFRRLRSPNDKPIWATHVVASNQVLPNALQFETDRAKFIGRGRSLHNPIALEGDLSNTQGTVLDPIFSLRYRVELAPGQRVQIAFTTAVADEREKAINLMKKYGDISACHRANEIAWSYAQLELRHLRIHQEEAQLFQKLASRILYPHAQLRLSKERLFQNRLGQSRLWAYSISGDLPIIVVAVSEPHDIDLVKQALTAHKFWRLRGLKVDLVILNEEAASYEHPLLDQVTRIIQSQTGEIEIAKPGGVYLINSEQIPSEDLTLILSVSRANLIAARGSLRQQLVSPGEPAKYPSRLIPVRGLFEEPSNPLPEIELVSFNGYGGFTKDGKEYVIDLGPNLHTPAPWINVIANPKLGTLVSEVGLGCTWYENSQSNRLTPWSNDPIINPVNDTIFIRDDDLGTYWSSTPSPIRELDAYRIRHGQGYSKFEHNSHAIEQELLIFVPIDDTGGVSIRVQKLKLKNASSRRRILSLMAYSEWVLGIDREDTQMHVITEWDRESKALFAYNRYHPDFGNCCAFTFTNSNCISFTTDRNEFLGRNYHPANPTALKRNRLSGFTGAAVDPCSALHVIVELEPGEDKEVFFMMGYAADNDTARQLISKCRDPFWVDQALKTSQEWWDRILGSIQIDTPDPSVNILFNRWLLYQNLSCRYWGRTAFYQSSGAYGFRDQLQDVAALVYSSPNITRNQILKAASRQFLEGDVQHWWNPPLGGGVRTRISDDLLWLPFITAHYIKITKDFSILNEQVPFIKGDLLLEDQHETYFIPETTSEMASVLDHCRLTIKRSLTSGPNGLPLIGGGDWNDGFNRVGIEGKGESVWLGWFLIRVIDDYIEMLTECGIKESNEELIAYSKQLLINLEKNAWDGSWYRRAYFDDGKPLGSSTSEEAVIDSLAQSWAIICKKGDRARAAIALKSVDEMLVLDQESLVLLFTPPFDKTPLNPGYIKGYPPGVRENGGQYTHGSLWVPMAFAQIGNADRAVQLLQMMMPTTHGKTFEEVNRYKVEPFVLAGDVYSLTSHLGRGGWTWYTGSASWMYRIWLEEIIGFNLKGEILSLQPSLPRDWKNVNLRYMFKNTSYQIQIYNNQQSKQKTISTELDGYAVPDNHVLLVDDGALHTVKITMS